MTLYVDPECEACRRLGERLAEGHLAHRVEPVAGQAANGPGPHALDDNGEIVAGHDAIGDRVDQTMELLQRARRYQSDLCHDYGDDKDPGLCGR